MCLTSITMFVYILSWHVHQGDDVAKKRSSQPLDVDGMTSAFQKVAARLDAWKRERLAIAAELGALVEGARMHLTAVGLSPQATRRSSPRKSSRRRRGTISPEGRARIAAAQRARWAKVRTSNS